MSRLPSAAGVACGGADVRGALCSGRSALVPRRKTADKGAEGCAQGRQEGPLDPRRERGLAGAWPVGVGDTKRRASQIPARRTGGAP
jgi:hypothetical protein